jgi:UDP-galactopyranose mutase
MPRILILGAGPTGLGGACRLDELGHQNFLVLEKNAYPGGLAASFADDKGFTWDIGGQVQFSHYDYFDQVMDRALGDAWVHSVVSTLGSGQRADAVVFAVRGLPENLRMMPLQEVR